MFNTNDVLLRALPVLGDAIAVIGGVALLHALYGYLAHKLSSTPKPNSPWASLAVILVLGLNTITLANLVQSVEDVDKTQQLKAEFQTGQNAYTFGRMDDPISDARDGGSIFILNSFETPYHGLSGNPEGAAKAEAARKQYFDLVEKKMDHVNYHRVIQIRDGETANLATLAGPTYIEHFKKMVALQTKPGGDGSTALFVSRAHYSVSFGIIENVTGRSYLNLQVDHRLSPKQGYDVAGNMIIVDPEKTIIRQFKTLFNEVEATGRRVQAEDLEATAPPLSIP